MMAAQKADSKVVRTAVLMADSMVGLMVESRVVLKAV